MTNTALNRSVVLVLTNKSGGSVAQGDVVILDSSTASSFTTTTSAGYASGIAGVVVEPNGIANNASGLVAVQGYVPLINLSGAASLADVFKTHSVAKQAVRHAAPLVAGDFGQVLGTGTTPAAVLWGFTNQAASSSASSLVSDKKTRTAGDLTTTSTTFADIAAGLNITLTTGARRCMLVFSASGQPATLGNNTAIDVDIDGARVGQTLGLIIIGAADGHNMNASFTFITDVLTAASHTFKPQWKVTGGTGTLFASTTVSPIFFSVVELPLKDPA